MSTPNDRSTPQQLYEMLTRLGHRIVDQTRFFTDKAYREEVLLARARKVCRDNWQRIWREISESRELVQLLWRYSQGEKLAPEEAEAMKQQLLDLVRVVPALGIFALPGGLILLPLLAKAFPWGLVPSAWRETPAPAPAGDGAEAAAPTTTGGVVTSQEGKTCQVASDAGVVTCVHRAKLFRGASGSSPVVVGDRVQIERTSAEEGVIVSVEPRRTRLSRRRKDRPDVEHVLVANVDRLAIIAAARDPAYDPAFVERVLVAARAAELEPFVVVNKMDIVDPKEIDPLVGHLERHGVPVIRASAVTGQGIDAIRAEIAGRTSAFCGHSGVGKSTLVNLLRPGSDRRTGEIIRSSGLGRHTTSDRVLLELPGGGYLIDMPGVREFGLWNVNRDDVDAFFPEIVALSPGCKFRGCSHSHEPSCAVKEAVASGEIEAARLSSYLRILSSL